MADDRVCSISGCCKAPHARGFCKKHYARWRRHGDANKTLLKMAGTGEPPRYFTEVVLPYAGDECLFWPYARSASGYGHLHLDGKRQIVSRLVCAAIHGADPTGNSDAAHSCGNGHLGCVTARHLSWKTRSGNIADMVAHGTARRGENAPASKLTSEDVRIIRSLSKTKSQREIADIFGVRQPAISRVLSGSRWGWLE